MTVPIDVAAVSADDHLVEDLRAGRTRNGDELERSLTEYRDFAVAGQQ